MNLFSQPKSQLEMLLLVALSNQYALVAVKCHMGFNV